jgi:hypothetical protein
MKLDASIEPTIGPYEDYEDGWFGAKAAFEAFVCVRDDAETAKLAKLAGELQEIENNLRSTPSCATRSWARWRRSASSTSSSRGRRQQDRADRRVQPPNDERIVKEVGSKRTMLKNVQRAKFDHVLTPISRIALSPPDRGGGVVRRVLHAHPDARADARPRPARDDGGRQGRQDDDRPRGACSRATARSKRRRPTSPACSRCST